MHPGGIRTAALALTVVVLAAAGEWFLAAVYGEDEVRCEQASVPVSLPALPEASGVAASRRHPGLLWAINDSPPGVLYALNDAGDVRTRLEVKGAQVTDWEDISVTSCPGGSCVIIGDIGDNDEQRDTIRVYRVPEPGTRATATASAEVFEARYPDRPHDAEALFAMPDGTLYLITKESPVATLYRFPTLEPGRVLTLERMAMLPIAKVTDADTSPDGQRVAIRSNDQVVFYRTRELLHGDVEHGAAVQVGEYNEPQGEGITFGASGTVYMTSEGGGQRAPGMLIQLRCSIPSAS